MVKKILFLIPRIEEKLWSNYYPEIYLGLAYMARLAREKGHNVRVIDSDADKISDQSILDVVRFYEPDIIAITALYGSSDNAKKAASLLKNNSHAKIVLGGLPATFATEEFLSTGLFDILVRGEGEMTFLDILEEKPLGDILGISYLKDGNVVHNQDRPYIEDLDSLGIPLREIFSLKRYKIRFQSHNSTAIETCRGCPYGCEFCTQKPKEGGKLRFRSVDMVKKELDSISQYRFIKRVMIVDNDFLVHKDHSEGILKMICRNHFNKRFDFMFATRVDNILRGGKPLLNLIKKSNVNTIFFGLESLSDGRREKIGKIKDIRKTKELFRTLENSGIDPLPSYIIGFPEEDRADINRTLEIAKEMNTRLFSFNILTPYPGTPFYERCKSEDILTDPHLHRYDNAHLVFRHHLDIQREFYRMHLKYLLRLDYLFDVDWRYFYKKPVFGRILYLAYFIIFIWLESSLRKN